MDRSAVLLGHIEKDSPIHRLTGAAKLIAFILWSLAVMFTYDTRVLVPLFALALVLCRITRVRWPEVKWVVGLAAVFMLLNNIFLFLFAPTYGCELYGNYNPIILQATGPYALTWEELFYLLNWSLKVAAVVPAALVFFIATDPSEFAASLNRIGLSYKVSYAVALALRYIPDVQRDYTNISQAQQARGVDLSRRDPLFRRLKNSLAILLPLIVSSLERIETVSNAMELRGFGKLPRRTWYSQKPFRRADYITIAASLVILAVSLTVTFWDGNRFYNPF